MPHDNNSEKSWTEWLRLATPIGLFVLTLFINGLRSDLLSLRGDIKEVDAKMFKHLTNDEIHTPKAIALTRPEFNIYQEMRTKEMNDLRDGICRIEARLIEHDKDARGLK